MVVWNTPHFWSVLLLIMGVVLFKFLPKTVFNHLTWLGMLVVHLLGWRSTNHEMFVIAVIYTSLVVFNYRSLWRLLIPILHATLIVCVVESGRFTSLIEARNGLSLLSYQTMLLIYYLWMMWWGYRCLCEEPDRGDFTDQMNQMKRMVQMRRMMLFTYLIPSTLMYLGHVVPTLINGSLILMNLFLDRYSRS